MSDATDTRPEQGLARDAALNLAARLCAMFCSSITALVIAATLSKPEYGAYSIVIGINVILVMALDLGLTSSLARYVAQGRAPTSLVIRVALLRLALIGAAAVVVLGTTLLPAVERSAIAPLLPMLAALVVTQSIISFHFGSLPAMRRIRLLLLVTVLQPAGELALVLLVRARDGGAAEMLLATTASGFAVAAVAWIALLAPGRAAAPGVVDAPVEQHATVRMVARYGRRIFLVSLLIAVIGQIDQFVIGFFHPLAEVAPYALAIKLQALVAAPAITMAGIVAPRIAAARSGALALYRQWLAFLVVLNLGAVVVLALLSSEAFGAIDARYRDDALLLAAMGPFLLLSAVAPLPSITLNQTGHAGARRRIAAVTLTINVVLDLALVPWLGAWGAVIATTAAFTWYLVRHHQLLTAALQRGEVDGEDTAAPALPPPGVDEQTRRLLLRTLARGVALTALAALLAIVVRELLHRAAGGAASDLVVLLGAGGAAALVHVGVASRILRRGTTPASE